MPASVRSPRRHRRPSAATVARRIGLPLHRWPGQCGLVAQACLRAHVVRGRLAYGLYHGRVAPESPFAGHPFSHHAWIVLADGRVWDPTRWVFEAARPYIYVGPATDYDLGGQRLTDALMGPPPAPGAPVCRLDLPPAALRDLGAQLGLPNWDGRADLRQLHWLAVLPLHRLGAHARALYRALAAAGYRVLIPIDPRQWILGRRPGRRR